MICIPVVAETRKKALQAIKRSAGLADLLEMRMDMLADGNVKELIRAARSASPSVKVLVTNRAKGPFSDGDEEKRIKVLLDAVSLGADYVDVELEAAPVLREKIEAAIDRNNNRTAMIVSHHDFHKTPSSRTLIGIAKECAKTKARVIKIVTLARVPEDNLSVLELIPYVRGMNREVIAFCMGEQGKISRIFSPLLGSLFTFASLRRGTESASGQLTVREMRRISAMLEKNSKVEI